MGNHVQVVLALSERGNFQEAHEHLACMAEVLNGYPPKRGGQSLVNRAE